MPAFRCPRCQTIVHAAAGESPVCHACGFPGPAIQPPVFVPTLAPVPQAAPPLTSMAQPDLGLGPPGQKAQRDLASVGQRVGGHFLDLGLRLLVLLPFTIHMFANYSTRYDTADGTTWRLENGAFLAWIGGWFLFTTVYYALFEAAVGASPGKFAAGTRVVGPAGGSPTFGRALVRNAMRFIDAIAGYLVGFVAITSSSTKQRVGDRLADTFVVRNPDR